MVVINWLIVHWFALIGIAFGFIIGALGSYYAHDYNRKVAFQAATFGVFAAGAMLMIWGWSKVVHVSDPQSTVGLFIMLIIAIPPWVIGETLLDRRKSKEVKRLVREVKAW
ncbi:MAG: hypothetical protein M1355_03175 [Patescibacteria group bacterium]|nr:hypothetical protein [Patescibacteria group bacterium]